MQQQAVSRAPTPLPVTLWWVLLLLLLLQFAALFLYFYMDARIFVLWMLAMIGGRGAGRRGGGGTCAGRCLLTRC